MGEWENGRVVAPILPFSRSPILFSFRLVKIALDCVWFKPTVRPAGYRLMNRLRPDPHGQKYSETECAACPLHGAVGEGAR